MHWIALQPQPEVLASALADPLTALGWWALQFTPKVARAGLGQAGQTPDMLVLEVLASERLFGGRQQLLMHIFKEKVPVVPVKYARGATSLIAIARLQTHGSSSAVESLSAPPCPVDALPLATLAAAQLHLPTLARIGCTHWGHLRALPRGGVVRRFGADLLDALDRAYGLTPELYPWLTLPEVFEAQLELLAQVETAPALMFGARRLLNQLQVWLQMRHCGVLAFELSWTMDARRNTAATGQLVVRTAQPTLDMVHLQRLLSENLARITLPAPVLSLHLRTLETHKLGGQSHSLLPDAQRPGDSLHQLLERLSARLGSENVLHCEARADHRPEHMQVWQPISSDSKLVANYLYSTGTSGINDAQIRNKKPAKPSTVAGPDGDALYPTWLLAQPLKLVVCNNTPQCTDGGPLTLLAGPQRLEAGWWDATTALRDYFLAHSEQMGLLWIYRERLTAAPKPQAKSSGQGEAGSGPDWYLHGLFG
jgi:protein ImuB